MKTLIVLSIFILAAFTTNAQNDTTALHHRLYYGGELIQQGSSFMIAGSVLSVGGAVVSILDSEGDGRYVGFAAMGLGLILNTVGAIKLNQGARTLSGWRKPPITLNWIADREGVGLALMF